MDDSCLCQSIVIDRGSLTKIEFQNIVDEYEVTSDSPAVSIDNNTTPD